MSLRKLASIQKILDIQPILGADKIERLSVLGWYCASQKGTFKVGDLCVYFEPDSMIPKRSWSEWLFKGNDSNKETVRLRTIRLKNQISQGLCLPISILTAKDSELANTALHESEDVTDILEIKKYEPPIPAEIGGIAKGKFPEFLEKTDEDRIQIVPAVLERHKGKAFYYTEKIDGASMTVHFRDNEFGVSMREWELKDSETNSLWKVAKELQLLEKLGSVGKNIAVQGEIYGEGIQKNKYKKRGQHFAIYNVFDIDKREFYSFKEFERFCRDLELTTVPIIDEIVLDHTLDELVSMSVGSSKINPEAMKEGLVFRPIIEERDPQLGRLSFKVLNPEFLMKYE